MAETKEEGPLIDRAASKNWKTRLAAYEELEKIFKVTEESDPKYAEYAPIWKGVVSDSNAAAQEKGMEALVSCLSGAKDAAKHANLLAGLIVEKCLSGRANTKAKGTEALLIFVEAENAEPVVTGLIKGCVHKVPKVRAASLETLREIIKQFGPKAMPIKPVLSALASFFDHPDNAIREEAFSLCVELYRWLGAVVRTQIDSLRPAQIKELETAFEEAKAQKAVPTRFTRSQQAKNFEQAVAAPSGGGQSGVAAVQEQEEIDPYELVDPVNILSKIGPEWLENISSPKWQIRKEQLETLCNAANVPKIQPGDFGEITKALKKLLGDANIVVVSKTCEALGLLARGLRKDFAGAKIVFPVLLDKFKEKKAQVVQAIHTCLDFMYDGCFVLADVMEDILATSAHKVPKVRQEVLLWLERCFKKSTTSAKRSTVSKVVKSLGNFFVECLEDGNPDVRDACGVTFGALAGVVGERPLAPYLNKLDKIKLQKVKDSFPQILPSGAPPPVVEEEPKKEAPKTPKGDAKPPTKPPPEVSKPKSGQKPDPPKKTPSSSKPKEQPKVTHLIWSLTPKKAAPAKGTKPQAKKKGGPVEAKESPSMSTEDALEKAKELIPESIFAMLNSSNWKERLSGISELSEFVQKMDGVTGSAEILIQQLHNKPGWKESNFQVCNSMFALIATIARSSDPFPKYATVLVVPGIVEKITDGKIKPAAVDCLTAFAEAHSTQFVFTQLYKHAAKHKSPKVPVETLSWIATAIEEFGMVSIQAKGLIDFIKELLESTNPTVKSQAIKTLCVMRRFVGATLRDFVADIKPALLSTIDEEFSKVADSPPQPAIRRSRDVEASQTGSGGGGGGSAAMDILPREDISGQITAALIKNFGDTNWKTRKEAIEQVQEIIVNANKRIESNLGGLLPALKARLGDSNKNLVIATFELLSLIATAMGPSVEKHMKGITATVFANFSDSKKNIRDAGAASLDAWVAETTPEPFWTFIPAAMAAVPSSDGRKDLLAWIVKHLTSLKASPKTDLTPVVKPTLVYIEDKSSEVRHLAETLLKEIRQHIGLEAIEKQCKELKPASKLLIQPLMDAMKLEQAKGSKSSKAQPSSGPAAAVSAPSKATKVPAPSKGGKKESPAKGPEKAPQKGQTIHKTNQKDQRVKKSKPRLGLDDIRQEVLDGLAEQLQPCVDPTLHSKMFSTDFKHHLEALAELSSCLPQYKDEMVDCLDLLLKWCAFRLADTNVSVLKNTLEFLQSLLGLLTEDQYQLTDHEAGSFLTVLVEKTGNNNETIRQGMKSLLNSIPSCCPASKLFSYIMEGIKSKNARTRVECLEELANLIHRHGAIVCNVSKVLPAFGETIADRDGPVRSAALNAIVAVYEQIREEIWKHLANLPESSKSALQEKLKHVKIPEQAAPKESAKSAAQKPKQQEAPRVEPTRAEPVRSVAAPTPEKESPFKLDMDKIDLPTVDQIELPYLEPTSTGGQYQGSSGNLITHTDAILANLSTGDPSRMIESLKMLCLNEDDSIFTMHSDKLALELTKQLHSAFNSEPVALRLYKYILNTLHKMFTRPTVAKALSVDSLSNLMHELMEGMADPKLITLEDGQYLGRALNLLMLSLLENADKTATFTVLLRALNLCVPWQPKKSMNPKFTELVMKSLLKVTKSLHVDVEAINVDLILRDIHSFLEAHPPYKWKTASDDMPLRTIKTILSEIVSLKGTAVTNHLTLVPLSSPPPAIVSYINLMLQTQHPNPRPTQEIKTILTDIFKKIGSKETTQEGLYDLYQFKKDHASVDIQPHLQRTSDHFQEYIKRGLMGIEQQYSSENRDPNAANSVANSDQFAVSYLDRLRKLQTQYGLKANEELPASETTVSIDALRMSINRMKSDNHPSDVFTEEVNTLVPGRRDDNAPAPAEPTVEELRQRLARIKNAM